MRHPSTDRHLDARSRRLLRALIAQYLADGQPVGSRTLARSSGLDVSPATIRNIMSDLEEVGLVAAPHTSAGRVPTAQGLRVFVDSLIELKPLEREELARLQQEMPESTADPRDLLGSVSGLLSAVTRFVGVVTVPRNADFPLRLIEFVGLPDNRVLAILVFEGQRVQNRVIQLSRPLSPSQLEQAANYLNQRFAGRKLEHIRQQLLGELRAAGSELNSMLRAVVEVTAGAFAPVGESDMMISGQANLMGYQELADMDRLRELFETFQRKRDLLVLLEQCAHAPGVRLFIGEESGLAPLDGCSVVTAPYHAGGRVLGALGIIGPTRMAYDRVIPVVQATADLLSGALNRVQTTQ
ncbi:MAG TPA: heat-inducible transcriptional repressor HrcA [Rhodanobacteraceae bacterium]|nr:heat-inducible transcriptional repressor HrcA [Rhodanobacteraceae bacterium]